MQKYQRTKVLIWSISVLLVIAGMYMLWKIFSKPTPAEAATIHMRKLIEGDIDWIYDHIPVEEKQIPNMSKEVLKEFYDTFLKEKLEGCEIIFIKEYFTIKNKAGVDCKLKLKDGTEIDVGTWAIVEEGKILVSAIETLVQFTSKVLYYDKGTTSVERVQYGWKQLSPWFVERGVEKNYSLQDGNYWPMKKQK